LTCPSVPLRPRRYASSPSGAYSLIPLLAALLTCQCTRSLAYAQAIRAATA
jgi:hypothetical protein